MEFTWINDCEFSWNIDTLDNLKKFYYNENNESWYKNLRMQRLLLNFSIIKKISEISR